MENAAQKPDKWSTIGRILFPAYLGALLLGAIRYDALGFLSGPMLPIVLFIPGLIAGNRKGLYSGALWGLLVFMSWLFPIFAGDDNFNNIHPMEAIRYIGVFLIVIVVAMVTGFIGGFVSKWIRLDAWLSRYKSWSTAGLVTASLLLYTWTIGGLMAARTIDAYTSNTESRSRIYMYAWGVYPVGVFTRGDSLEEYAVTDPTGLVVLELSY